jgi:hypothetical protein
MPMSPRMVNRTLALPQSSATPSPPKRRAVRRFIKATVLVAIFLGGVGASQADPGQSAGSTAAQNDAPAPKKSKPSKKPSPDAEITLKGDMTCARCGLHEGTTCQNVLRVKEGQSEVKYYLAKNPVSEENHGKVCAGSAPATVTGKLSTENGKKLITPSAVKFD